MAEHSYRDAIAWAATSRTPITGERVRERFSVSRATAYRWARSLERDRVQIRVALGIDLRTAEQGQAVKTEALPT